MKITGADKMAPLSLRLKSALCGIDLQSIDAGTGPV
jgi:hypothetical protein